MEAVFVALRRYWISLAISAAILMSLAVVVLSQSRTDPTRGAKVAASEWNRHLAGIESQRQKKAAADLAAQDAADPQASRDEARLNRADAAAARQAGESPDGTITTPARPAAPAAGNSQNITTTSGSTTSMIGEPATAADNPQNSPSANGPTFENGVLTTPDLKIQITRYKIIKAGQKGNEYGDKPVIAFWYKTTNLSGAQVDPTDFMFDFRAYQDNNPNAVNELDVGLTASPDDRFRDSQTETIKKGGTVENAIAYELDDLVTPVDLVASDGVGSEVIGKATYPLR